jgi:NhaP-type Na+/H+ or K+/H+ antiporter
MLFAQGFTLKKNSVIKNIGYISIYGILGTFLFYVIIVLLLLAANNLSILLNILDLVRDAHDITNIRTLSIWEVLLLGACFCSIDTIASEEAVSPRRFPKLNSIIFGEGIFKDTITIVLFRSILRL